MQQKYFCLFDILKVSIILIISLPWTVAAWHHTNNTLIKPSSLVWESLI